jgi:hypothetical protein
MNHKIIRKIEFNERVSKDNLEAQIFESFRQLLDKDGFRTFYENSSLRFDRKIENKTRSKGAIIEVLIVSIVCGKVQLTDKGTLIITLNYSKQLIVSAIVGLLTAFIIGIVSDYNSTYMIVSFLIPFLIVFFTGYLRVYSLIMQNLKSYSR